MIVLLPVTDGTPGYKIDGLTKIPGEIAGQRLLLYDSTDRVI